MGWIKRIFPVQGLSEEEEAVVKLLKKGPMKQKKLIQQLGMNPVKFNKVIRSLEEHGIAKREPHGRENVVKLL